jgi:hypothetical protein
LRDHSSYGDEIVDKVTVEKLLKDLPREEQVLLEQLFVHGERHRIIAEILSENYREGSITGSGVRWIRDKILTSLRARLEADGIRNSSG